jgi:hypothetical protein
MGIKGKVFKGLLIALSLALIPVAATSAQKITPGSVCKTVNQKATYLNKTYTCIKSGKKLVWNKGVAIATPAPTPTPSATPTPTPTPTPTQTPQPIAPSSFEDLQSHLDGIIYGAWSKASQKIQSSVSVLGNTKILVGPNTKEDDSNSLVALNLASKLYSGMKQVKNLYVIKFSFADVAWAQQQYDLIHPINYYATGAADSCNFLNCNGATAGTNSAGDGVILIGQGGNYSSEPVVAGGSRASTGLVTAHEYTHTIQLLNAPCQGSLCWGDTPVWLREGGAEWSGVVSRHSGNFNDYVAIRKGDLGTEYSLASRYTADYVTAFLNPNPYTSSNTFDWSYWDKYDRWAPYAIGFMATEILVNIKSPEAVMKLFIDLGAGKSFIVAFKEEFGIAWSDACPIIAKAIASEIEQGIKK